jgi:hypothetical protein
VRSSANLSNSIVAARRGTRRRGTRREPSVCARAAGPGRFGDAVLDREATFDLAVFGLHGVLLVLPLGGVAVGSGTQLVRGGRIGRHRRDGQVVQRLDRADRAHVAVPSFVADHEPKRGAVHVAAADRLAQIAGVGGGRQLRFKGEPGLVLADPQRAGLGARQIRSGSCCHAANAVARHSRRGWRLDKPTRRRTSTRSSRCAWRLSVARTSPSPCGWSGGCDAHLLPRVRTPDHLGVTMCAARARTVPRFAGPARGRRWQQVRADVMRAFAFRCAKCGAVGVPLEVHHRDHDHTHNDLGNLLPLCRGCHRRAK